MLGVQGYAAAFQTNWLEIFISDVDHCVGSFMQTSLSASACVIRETLTSFIQPTEIKLFVYLLPCERPAKALAALFR